jgi:hypothetical protein
MTDDLPIDFDSFIKSTTKSLSKAVIADIVEDIRSNIHEIAEKKPEVLDLTNGSINDLVKAYIDFDSTDKRKVLHLMEHDAGYLVHNYLYIKLYLTMTREKHRPQLPMTLVHSYSNTGELATMIKHMHNTSFSKVN